MNNVRLFVSGEELDVAKVEQVPLTKKCFDIENPTKIELFKSAIFDLPLTTKNRRLLNMPHLPMSLGSSFLIKYESEYYQNGVDLLEGSGVLVINSIEKGSINCTIFKSDIDFFDFIKDKYCSELTGLQNIPWTLIDAADSNAYVYSQYYKYLPCRFTDRASQDCLTESVKATRLIPFIFVKNLIDKIFTDAGKTYVWQYTEPAEFAHLFINLNAVREETDAALSCTGYNGAPINLAVTIPNLYIMDGTLNDNFDQILYNNIPSFGNTYYYKCASDGRIKLKFVWDLLVDSLTTFQFKIYKVNDSFDIIYTYTQIYGAGTSLIGNFTTEYLDVKKGDCFTLIIYSDKVNNVVNVGSYFKIDSYYIPVAIYNTNFNFINTLQDIKQTELVREVLIRFGAMMQMIDGVINLFTFKDVCANQDNCYDWSDKIILTNNSQELDSIKFNVDEFKQKTWYTHKKDDADKELLIKDDDSDSYVTCGNTNLEAEGTVFESIFSGCATDNMYTYTDIPIIEILHYAKEEVKDELGVTNTEFNQDWQKINTRILSEVQKPGHTLGMYEGSVGGGDYSEVTVDDPWVGLFLGFKYWYDNYLIYLEKILSDPKFITHKFNISLLDFQTFDHSRPVYLKQFSSFFFVPKINNFVVGKPTEIDIYKLNL